MEGFKGKISIQVSEKVYLKQPDSSALGKKIVSGAIDMIDEKGFEDFTFKKLAKAISSTEASIYRYFTSKHNLLVYLILWYWGWQEYRLILATTNVEDPRERLKKALKVLVEKTVIDTTFSQVDEEKLQRIVISESGKAYFSKAVDHENEMGYFKQYKDVVQGVADLVLDVNPNFKYPHMLVSTVIGGAQHQRYFAEHLPKLTDVIEGEDAISDFYLDLVFKEIEA
ncbi:TetR/AcrR family transcriptional regulator [Lishizhenia sp.]|uniref:TetR/AcrR family transcriptional regulator n=1 Tax=Lishizhenia sp. TaxID=2497594 RepID=UPI00299E9DF0|nr:TetR/AcrR family transcriptional regulator [Lishizhenia sp.]MDX1445413.1 TetR/AcrR family transcriptional regulator [Lishizhenia sp.]